MVMTGRIYVPSAVEEGGAVVGMGCFSTQETAMNVLRSFLKKSHQVPLERASIATWEVDARSGRRVAEAARRGAAARERLESTGAA